MKDYGFKEYAEKMREQAELSKMVPTPSHIGQVSKWLEDHGYKNRDQKGFNELCVYLCRRSKGLRRGLLLTGGNGSGKTSFFKAAFPKLWNVSASTIALRVKDEGISETVDTFGRPQLGEYFGGSHPESFDMLIDDVGAEPIINDYGTKLQVIGEVISERYTLWQNIGSITSITTNLSGTKFAEIYGARIFSRVMEMCVPVSLNASDFRIESLK